MTNRRAPWWAWVGASPLFVVVSPFLLFVGVLVVIVICTDRVLEQFGLSMRKKA